MFAFMFLIPINSLVSSVNVQNQNYQNKQFHFFYNLKHPNVYQHMHIHQGLLCIPHRLILCKLFIE